MQEQTYDPVLEVTELSRWRLTSPLRPPDPGRALVLVRDSGPSLTVRSGEEIPSARYGGYRSVHTVDLGEHRLVLDVPLLSRDPTFSFRSRVDLICGVTDPAKIVARGIRDMSGALYGFVRKTLREVARDYDIAEFHQAERALNGAVASFAGDDAVRLRGVHVELLVDEDEIVTSGREFRDVERETRLSRMRRTRHVEMMREEGVDGLIAEIMEKEGPRAALAWIEKSDAEQREVRREVMRMVLERGDADREPFEQTELERAVLDEVLRGGGDGLFSTATRRGRLTGSLSRALEPGAGDPGAGDPGAGYPDAGDPPGARASSAPDGPGGAPRPSTLKGEVLRDGPRLRGTGRRPAPDAPPEDEPLPPRDGAPSPPRRPGQPSPTAHTARAAEPAGPRASRVRGTAARRTTDPGREPR
ncbi:hypothetical protein ABZ930_15485 [Streptomyces sp. NPDC046716]|uniref:hypothetical protein n=1 Tax=Streptomyces sp. NPDC046716 TaxID=3157093 RepID=UPI0033E6976A